MGKKDALSKTLAILGTVVVWFPVLVPVVSMVISLIESGHFNFDYLMPAELAPVVLVGWILLLLAAIRMKAHRMYFVWCLVAAVVFIVGGSLIAMVTGLASGATEPDGWQWALVLAMIAGYILSIVAAGVGGILLCVELFRREP